MKTLTEIEGRIRNGRAKVMTAEELKDAVKKGDRPTVDDVDVVTCGTFGVISGTMAILCIPVAEPGVFGRASRISLNGVPAYVGPCPNESLGMVDAIVYGTSRRDLRYGGGHLFRDMVSGADIKVDVVTEEGINITVERKLSDFTFARMHTTRSFFKNYSCFATGKDARTIFCGTAPMPGDWKGATFSGCGDINPVENDPELRFLRPGASVFVNGVRGMVVGTGTRSTKAKPNLSVEADMQHMRPEYMGGFITSAGPECTISLGASVPVTDDDVLDRLCITNDDVELPLCDVRDRIPLFHDTYGSVWTGSNDTVTEDHSKCLRCDVCEADARCPREARPSTGIDRTKCIDCGICVGSCAGGVFACDLGSVAFGDRTVNVIQRQSSRKKGKEVCEEIKMMIKDGNWSLGLFNEIV